MLIDLQIFKPNGFYKNIRGIPVPWANMDICITALGKMPSTIPSYVGKTAGNV